jgi:choline-sulfatase
MQVPCAVLSLSRVRAPGYFSQMPLDLVLVTVDTLRADRLGCYGHAPAATPQLDALAARGLLFLDASTTAPTTLPAHTSLLSGDWVHAHGVDSNHDTVPSTLQLLPDRLSRAGYATAAFVSGSPLGRWSALPSHFQVYDDARPDSLGSRYPPERRAQHTVQAAVKWLQSAHEPFFLWVHLYDPHLPYTTTYDAEVAAVDSAVGELLSALRGRQAAVVVVSDHGEGMGEHGEAEHGIFLYQATVRVPLIVSAPGLLPARRTEPVSVVDVAPTLLALAGLPEDLPGLDLRGPIPRDRVLHASTTHGWERYGWAPLAAVRRGSFKAIDAPRPELYDLAVDAAERHDRFPGDGSWTALFPARPGSSDPAQGELAQQLIALGYAASEPAPTESAPDPKDKIVLLPKLEAASAALHAGRPAEVEVLLKSVLASDPGNPAALNDLGMAQIQLEKYPQAVSTLRRATERSPHDSRVWNNLGLAARRAGDLAQARSAYARSAELDPTFAVPCYNRATLELDAGDEAEAARWVDEALRRDPRMAEAKALRGRL